LRELIRTGMDEIQVHTCMMLDGSEMGTPNERKKWKLNTKFRLLQRDFVELSSGKKVMEMEEVVVSSEHMTFDEYVDLRVLAFVIYVTNRGIVYDPITTFLKQQNLDVFDYFCKIKDEIYSAPKSIQNVFKRFKDTTIGELWDSPEEIVANYQKDSEYQKLLNGEAGINVMYHFLSEVISQYMDEWAGYILNVAYDFLKNSNPSNQDWEKQFHDISNFCKGTAHNTLGKDRMVTNPEFEFNYNIIVWLKSVDGSSLDHFLLPKPTKISFQLSDKQFKSVQKTLEMYGETIVGKSKALRMISSTNLWRHPVIEKSMESLERKLGRSLDRTVMEIWDDHSSMRLNRSNENSS